MFSLSVVSNSLWPHGLYSARLLCLWGFSRQEYWSRFPCPPPGDLPNPGIKPRFPALGMDALPAEPPGKPKNTGVGSPSLLQGNFLTQELNQGLLHCRWILYQLSYQGSPVWLDHRQANSRSSNEYLLNLIECTTRQYCWCTLYIIGNGKAQGF